MKSYEIKLPKLITNDVEYDEAFEEFQAAMEQNESEFFSLKQQV